MTQVRIHYDGDCPLCTRFARRVRLAEAVERLDLIDLRTDDAARGRWQAAGFDLDRGFIVEVDEAVYHGAPAMQALALMSGRSGLANRLFAALFRHQGLARALYPALVAGRGALLALRGRGGFSDADR